MGLFSKSSFFHPNRFKAAAGAAAEDQKAEMVQKAAAKKVELAQQKQKSKDEVELKIASMQQDAVRQKTTALAKHDADYMELLTTIAIAERDMFSKHEEEATKVKSWGDEVQDAIAKFWRQHARINYKKQGARMSFIAAAKGVKQRSDNLLAEEFLQLKCSLSAFDGANIFDALIDPLTDIGSKVNLYSEIDSRLQTLAESAVLRKFVYDASFGNLDWDDPNVKSYSVAVHKALGEQYNSYLNRLYISYINDSSHITSKHIARLQEIDVAVESLITLKGQASKIKSSAELQLEENIRQQLAILQQRYLSAKDKFEKERTRVEAKFTEAKTNVMEVYAEQLEQITTAEHLSYQNIEVASQQMLAAIQAELSISIEDINQNLAQKIKTIDKKRTTAVANVATVAASLTGACFVGPMLAGTQAAGTAIQGSLQSSLISIGAKAASNILNGKAKGPNIDIKVAFSLGGESSTPATSSQRKMEVCGSKFEIAALKQEYDMEVLRLSSIRDKIKNNLYASLTKPLEPLMLSEESITFMNRGSRCFAEARQDDFVASFTRGAKDMSRALIPRANQSSSYVAAALGQKLVGRGELSFWNVILTEANIDSSNIFPLQQKSSAVNSKSIVAIADSRAFSNFTSDLGWCDAAKTASKLVKDLRRAATCRKILVAIGRSIGISSAQAIAPLATLYPSSLGDGTLVELEQRNNFTKVVLSPEFMQDRQLTRPMHVSEGWIERFPIVEKPKPITLPGPPPHIRQAREQIYTTPVVPQEPLLFNKRGHIRRIECDNGLVYEDAPYHNLGNAQKSKAPEDPKYALENSRIVKSKRFGERRISYDPKHDEIVVLDGKEGLFHGHVKEWAELQPKHKNILKEHFGFKLNGKKPKV